MSVESDLLASEPNEFQDRVYWNSIVEAPGSWPRGTSLRLKDGVVTFEEYHYDAEENYKSYSKVEFKSDEFIESLRELQKLKELQDQKAREENRPVSVFVYGKDSSRETDIVLVDNMKIELRNGGVVRMIVHEHRSKYQLRRNSVSVNVDTNLGRLV